MKTVYILTIVSIAFFSINCMITDPNDFPPLTVKLKSLPVVINKKEKKKLKSRINSAIENENLEDIEILLEELSKKKVVCTNRADQDWIDENITKLNNKLYDVRSISPNPSEASTQESICYADDIIVGGFAEENTDQDDEEELYSSTYSTQIEDLFAENNFKDSDLTESVMLFNQLKDNAKKLEEDKKDLETTAKELKIKKEAKITEQQQKIESLKKELEEEVKKLAKNEEEYSTVMKAINNITNEDREQDSKKEKAANNSCAIV